MGKSLVRPASGGGDHTRQVDLPADWKPPNLTLILAATPRSGSTLLARLVDSTGLFRRTTEYFNNGFYRQYGVDHPTLARKLEEMDRRSRTDLNFLSVKFFPNHMAEAIRFGLVDTAFANARYVHIVRRDLLGQAISLVRATTTDEWQSSFKGNEKRLEYDEATITREILTLSGGERWWRLFFASRDVPVLQVAYENLEADPQYEVRRIVSFLGFEPDRYPADLSKVDPGKQRDEMNEEWRRLYLASCPGLGTMFGDRPAPRTLRNFVRFMKGELFISQEA
jgi:LPS sulfotransferase NodH